MKKDHEIIYEDQQIVIVNKAAGLLTIPDRYQHDKRNLFAIIQNIYEQIYIVHRIDRETSGLVIFAKDADTHRLLSMAFEEGKIHKTYMAIVRGQPNPLKDRIETYLTQSETVKGKIIVFKKGKHSITEYEVLESYNKKYSLVKVNILTGRTHQIRVHMQYIGHPLLVDTKYGGAESFKLSEIKKRKFRLGKEQEERPLLDRHSLHAAGLSFDHPITGKNIELEVPVPKDMKAVIYQMRKILGQEPI